jgi:Universal stress protein family
VKSIPAAAGFVHTLVANSIVRKNVRVLKAREEVDSALTKLRSTGLKTSFMVKDEEMKQLLCSEAENWRADCIFVESREMESFDRSSLSAVVAANAFCSVEVIRAPTFAG